MARNSTSNSATNSTLSELASIEEAGFGSFVYFCKDVSSIPWCNLFYSQLSKTDFILQPPRTASVGINPDCGIPRAGDGRFGNLTNDIMCGLSACIVFYLIQRCNRRKAAVGRVEIRALLVLYLLSCILQLLTAGGIFEQGSIPLVVLTAVHAGIVATFFWALFGNAIVATQVVEDGTPASLLPFYGFSLIFFLATTYIAIDTGMGFTSIFKSAPPEDLKNMALFTLLWIWPAIAALIYIITMTYVVISVLKETKPLVFYWGSFFLFAGSQAIKLLASKPLCQVSKGVIDGSFLHTLLETASIGVLFAGWMTITEASWDIAYFPA